MYIYKHNTFSITVSNLKNYWVYIGNWPFESKLWWNPWSKLYFKLTKSWNQQLLVNYADNSNSHETMPTLTFKHI